MKASVIQKIYNTMLSAQIDIIRFAMYSNCAVCRRCLEGWHLQCSGSPCECGCPRSRNPLLEDEDETETTE